MIEPSIADPPPVPHPSWEQLARMRTDLAVSRQALRQIVEISKGSNATNMRRVHQLAERGLDELVEKAYDGTLPPGQAGRP